jgi:predicted kinase
MNWLQKISQQKMLIMARGPSGSGKSRMAQELGEKLGAPVLSSDDFFMVNGEYRHDPEYITEAHFWNHGRVEEAMEGRNPIIIVDNTNAEFWEMKPYVQMAQKHGYGVTFKEPDWTTELKTPEGQWDIDFLERMQQQPDRDKSVPREAIERMINRYEYNPSVESVLKSERPKRLAATKRRR